MVHDSRGRLEMVQLLIQHGANTHSRTDPPHKTPMQLAAAEGHLHVMEELVKKGMDWKEKDDWGWTLLHEVAAAKDAEGIKWVSLRSRDLSNITDKLGRTPLLTALIAGAGDEAVSELLKHGADPGIDDDVGRTTTEAAILYCSSPVIQIIIEACIQKNENESEDTDDKIEMDKANLLSIANGHPEVEAVKKIFETFLC